LPWLRIGRALRDGLLTATPGWVARRRQGTRAEKAYRGNALRLDQQPSRAADRFSPESKQLLAGYRIVDEKKFREPVDLATARSSEG
jgi:hypothetical protein